MTGAHLTWILLSHSLNLE